MQHATVTLTTSRRLAETNGTITSATVSQELFRGIDPTSFNTEDIARAVRGQRITLDRITTAAAAIVTIAPAPENPS